MEGRFIVVEGIDGAGTTTLTERLALHYRSKSLPVQTTREPSSGPIGSLIRQALGHRLVVPGAFGPRPPSWATMALLFAADRADHLEAEVLPLLQDGVMVICDRYDLSSLAYQSATSPDETEAGRDRTVAWIRELNHHARRPDLTLVVDVRPEVARERLRGRGTAVELYEDPELQRRLAAAYGDAERFVPGDRVIHLDGNQPLDAVVVDATRAVDATT